MLGWFGISVERRLVISEIEGQVDGDKGVPEPYMPSRIMFFT
jgi:hypothetical protein